MTDAGLNAIPNAVEGWVSSFVGRRKLKKHNAESVGECFNFVFGLKPHDILFPYSCRGVNLYEQVKQCH